MEADGLIPLSQDESDLQSKVEIPNDITFEMENDMSKFTEEAKPILTAEAQQTLNGSLFAAIKNSAEQEDVAKISELIKAGADVNAQGDDGYTALIWAIDKGHIETAELLIKHGADSEAKFYGRTALMRAAEKGRTAIAELLIKYGADSEATDQFGNTALRWAVEKGHTAIAELLIKHGANVNANLGGGSALMLAAYEGHTEMVELFIKHGADIHAQDVFGNTALMFAQSNPKTAHVLEVHNQRLDNIATLLVNRTKRDAKGYITGVNVNGMNADQQKLLEDAYKFNRDNIRDAIAKKLTDQGMDVAQAKDQAGSVIDGAKSHYLNTIDKAKSYEIAKAGREEGRSFPKGNIDTTADIVRFPKPEYASNLSKALDTTEREKAASLGKKMLTSSNDSARDDRKPSGATPPSPPSPKRTERGKF